MKRLVPIGLLVGLLVALVVVAPALSLRPYRPEPVMFSMSGTGKGKLVFQASRGGGVVSKPLRTRKRFNMVGLTWRGSQAPRIRLRTRKQGGRWSRWVRLDAHAEDAPDPRRGEPQAHGTTAPTWAGEADWVQYRTSRRLPGLRLQFVNVRGTATRADRMRSSLRRVASAGVLSVAGIARAASANAAAGRPRMVSRAQWGASQCKPRTSPDYGEVDAAVIHHTVNTNDYSRSEAPDVVLGICLYHRNSNGWNDIGYNFLVDRFGTLYEGRAGGTDEAVIGAHAQGYNAQTTGIANLGTFSSVKQSPAALASIPRLIRWKLPLHGAPTAGPVTLTSTGGPSNRFPVGRRVHLRRVIGHRDTGATSCPGNALYAQLSALRRLVGSSPVDTNGSQLEARATKAMRYGKSAGVSGRLIRSDGAALAGMMVNVDARVGRRWKTLSSARTDAAGRFAARVKLKSSRMLRTRFAGAGAIGAAGKRFRLGVRPYVKLSAPVSAAAIGGRVGIRGRLRPRKGHVYQVLQQRRHGRFEIVGVKRLAVSRAGRFHGSFIPTGRSRYRYYVVAKADKHTVRGASRKYAVAVGRRGSGGIGVP